MKNDYLYFFAALTFAHLARAAALIRASPAAEMWRFLPDSFDARPLPLTLAHLALCAAAIRARAAADMVRPVRVMVGREAPFRDARA